MEIKELECLLEGILFTAGEPVPVERLCQCLSVEPGQIEQAIKQLADYYSFERRGIRLLRLADAVQLCSAPEYAELICNVLETRKPPRLSQPALEVLTIAAYFQPVTRAYIDQVRGVDSAYTVGLLLERGLLEEAGRLSVPGRPILYRTTEAFLRVFGLSSLEELPPLPEQEEEGALLQIFEERTAASKPSHISEPFVEPTET